jgi:hypothetical protein
MVKIIGICAPRIACAATSTQTLRRAVLSLDKAVVLVMEHG